MWQPSVCRRVPAWDLTRRSSPAAVEAEVPPLPHSALGGREPCVCPGRGRVAVHCIRNRLPRGVAVPAGHPPFPAARTPARRCRSPPRSGRALRDCSSAAALLGQLKPISGAQPVPLFCGAPCYWWGPRTRAVLRVSSKGCGNLIYPCVQNGLNIGLAINRNSQTTNPNQKKGSRLISRISNSTTAKQWWHYFPTLQVMILCTPV